MSRRDAVRELAAPGFRPRRRAKHCEPFAHPCGATASLPITPSDHRSLTNALADARRAIRQKETT